RRGQRGRAIARAEIQHLQSLRDAESLYQGLAALPHGLGDASEIALFPKCFVRIRFHGEREIVAWPIHWQILSGLKNYRTPRVCLARYASPAKPKPRQLPSRRREPLAR